MVGRARMFSSPSLSPLVEGSSTGLGALWREDPFAKVKAAREAAQLQAMEIPVMRAFIRPRPEQENIPRELLLANGRTPAQVSTNASDTSRVRARWHSRPSVAPHPRAQTLLPIVGNPRWDEAFVPH
jgi:hypothetical protein